MTILKNSSRLVFVFGFLFLGLAAFDSVRHIHDPITYTYVFLAVLAFVIASCLQSIEKRLSAMEQSFRELAATRK